MLERKRQPKKANSAMKIQEINNTPHQENQNNRHIHTPTTTQTTTTIKNRNQQSLVIDFSQLQRNRLRNGCKNDNPAYCCI